MLSAAAEVASNQRHHNKGQGQKLAMRTMDVDVMMKITLKCPTDYHRMSSSVVIAAKGGILSEGFVACFSRKGF